MAVPFRRTDAVGHLLHHIEECAGSHALPEAGTIALAAKTSRNLLRFIDDGHEIMTRERAMRQRDGTANMASAETTTSPREPHLLHPAGNGDEHNRFVEQVDATVARRVEALVDMLAWVRIEMAATHPDGAATPSDHERLQRALVQIEMALAMTKQLATELRRQQKSTQGA